MTASALYLGAVTHRRFRPTKHQLRYRLFFALFDLDEIDKLAASLRWFSRGRFNLFSFFDTDHGDGSDVPLRGQVEASLAKAGIAATGLSIRLLCLPRMLGYAFNPLSVYFCHRSDGELVALIYEVSNTFGERHSYLIPAAADDSGTVSQHCEKRFFVSPFLDMDMGYDFTVRPPEESILVTVKGSDSAGPLITATFAGDRAELTDARLLSAFVRYPLLTLKVIAGIHYEAALMWLKGLRTRSRPRPPESAVTIVRDGGI